MNLYKLIFFTLSLALLLGCDNNTGKQLDFTNLSPEQLRDTNVYFSKNYMLHHSDEDYNTLLVLADMQIKKAPGDFSIALNKLNVLSLKPPYNNAITYCDSLLSIFKNEGPTLTTLLIAKGDLLRKSGNNDEAVNAYKQADKLTGEAIYKDKTDNDGVFNNESYSNYITTCCLVYNNNDTIQNRIANFKKLYPEDSTTLNALKDIKCKP